MEQNRLSVGKLFLDLIIRPGSAFQSLTVRTAVWLVIIMAVAAIIFSSGAAFSRLRTDVIEKPIQPELDEIRGIEEGIIIEETFSPSPALSFGIMAGSLIGALIGFGVSWMVKSSILLGAIGLAGGKIGWKESVAVVGASWVPFFFHHLLKGTAALLAWQVPQFTGVAATFVSHLNIFVLWNLVLLTIGFTVAAGIPRVKAFACAAGYQAVVILINLGLVKLGGAITGGMF